MYDEPLSDNNRGRCITLAPPRPDAARANTGEVKGLRHEMGDLKELVADLTLENRLLKKSMTGVGGDHE